MSQSCGFTDLQVVDNDTIEYFLFINEAGLDDLSDPNQGLCQIDIAFEHAAIQDLSIELISPNGQSIILLGPLQSNSPLTNNASWDVSFLPCSSSADPFIGTSAIWNNLDNWQFFSNYSGSYYPNIGCLEDFNEGSVTGLWTIRIIDAFEFDTGEIFDINLTFCDQSDISCQTCEGFGLELMQNSINHCFGDATPTSIFDPTSSSIGNVDMQVFESRYLIFSEDTISHLQSEVALEILSPGEYEICLLTGINLDSKEEISEGISKMELQDYIEEFDVCSVLGDTCVTVNIFESLDTIVIDSTICSGDILDIFDLELSDAGTYFVEEFIDPCYQHYEVRVDVLEIEARINTVVNQLSCTIDSIYLDALNSSFSVGGQIQWLDENQNVIGNMLGVWVDTPGWYYLEITENNCNSLDSIQIVNDNSLPNGNFVFDDLSCFQPSTVINANFDRPIQSYSWTLDGVEFSTIEDPIISQGGSYELEVTLSNGCQASFEVTVMEDFAINPLTINSETLNCDVNSTLLEVDYLGAISYAWTMDNEAISNMASPEITEPGNYQLIYTESNGCADTIIYEQAIDTTGATLQLDVPELKCNLITAEVIVNADLEGNIEADGPLIINITDNSIIVGEAGNYSMSYTSTENGCITTAQFTVDSDDEIPDFEIFNQQLACGDDSIQIANNVLTANLSFEWSGPGNYSSNEAEPFAYSSGQYTVVATGSNGCIRTDTIFVFDDISTPSFQYDYDTLSCDQSSIQLIANTTTPYDYTWNGPSGFNSTSASPFVSEGGLYSVTVTDINNPLCTQNYSLLVETDTLAPSYNLEGSVLDCNTDSVLVAIEIIDSLQSFSWSGPSFSSMDTSFYTQTEGDYIIELVGENGCSFLDTIEIPRIGTLPSISLQSDTLSCSEIEAQITLTTDIGETFDWSGPDNFASDEMNVTVSQAGLYTVTVTSVNGCSAQESIEVQSDTNIISVDVLGSLEFSCFDDDYELSLVYDEPITAISWTGLDGMSTSDSIIVVNGAGTYYYEIISINGCIVSDSIEVIAADVDAVGNVTGQSIDCYTPIGNVAVDIVSPMTEASWVTPSGAIIEQDSYDTQEEGYHYLTLTSVSGCTYIDSILITEDLVDPDVMIEGIDTISCLVPTLDLTVNSSLDIDSVVWTVGGLSEISISNQISLDIPGLLQVTTFATNGCTDTQLIQIEADTIAPSALLTGGTLSCNESKIEIDASYSDNVIDFRWEGPEAFLSTMVNPIINVPGDYAFIMEADNGCVDTAIVNIVDDLQPRIIDIEDQFLPCNDDSISIVIDNLEEFNDVTWFGPNSYYSISESPMVRDTGMYIVFAQGVNGCIASDSFTVFDIPIPPVFGSENYLVTCDVPNVELIATNVDDDMLVEWYDPLDNFIGNNGASAQDSGQYSVIVTGQNFCKDTQFIQLSLDIDPPIFEIINSDVILCDQQSYMIGSEIVDTITNYAYTWSTEDGLLLSDHTLDTVRIGSVGDYYLELVDLSNGCKTIDTTTVIEGVEESILIEATLNDPSCFGQSDGEIILENQSSANGPYSYQLNQGATQADTIFDMLSSGDYVLTAMDRYGCETSYSYQLEDGIILEVNLGDDFTMNLGDSVLLIANHNAGSFDQFIDSVIWDVDLYNDFCDNCEEIIATPLETSEVVVWIETDSGCVAMDTLLITVDETNTVYLPNSFSPNGDDNNDIYQPGYSNAINMVNDLEIYDAWGNKIHNTGSFTPNDTDVAYWDGTFQGKDVMPGVYVVRIEYQLINGELEDNTSTVTLMR